MGPLQQTHQFRGYLHSKPPPPVIPFHDPYDMSSFLPPPEYLRKMPPPMHNNQLPMPKLPYTPDSYETNMQQHNPRGSNNGFYPPPPTPPWRSMGPQNMYRSRPPMQAPVPPAVNMIGSHPTRHFRSGSAMELHGR